MYLGVFRLGGDVIEVVIKGNDVLFRDTSSQMITPLEGLKLSRSGVIKEFPDLKDDDEWKKKAAERFKEHIKKMKTESETLEYVKEELCKFGWTALVKQRAGWRAKKF